MVSGMQWTPEGSAEQERVWWEMVASVRELEIRKVLIREEAETTKDWVVVKVKESELSLDPRTGAGTASALHLVTLLMGKRYHLLVV